MKTTFLHRAGNSRLLIYFDGWSRDAECMNFLNPGAFDVLEVCDYTALEDLRPLAAGYESRHLIAWSLGVWAAARTEEVFPLHPDSALAVNGTLAPVDAEYGIAPDVFDGTIDHWSEERAREKFLLRLAGNRAALEALPRPRRTWENQQAELRAIREQTRNAPPVQNCFTRAVVGTRDRIFPPEHQIAAWRKAGLEPETADLPHYPFEPLKFWEEAFHLGNH